ncbi:P-loop containing nucleoside triphosphate hydrolase protein [Atractiella rhizophila]|nr:P-loop containing nucleoside triphosphate hydrolase protein [Atractiella rhizophila]
MVRFQIWKRNVFSSSYLALYRFCGPAEWTLFLIGLIACIASGAPLPIIGILFGQLVDDFTSTACDETQQDEAGFRKGVNQKVVYLLIVAAANWALIWTYTVCFGIFGERMSRLFRIRYLRALLGQEMEFFDVGDDDGDLTNWRLARRIGLSEKLSYTLSSLSYFLTAYLISLVLLPSLALLFLPIIPAFAVCMYVGNRFSRKYDTRKTELVEAAEGMAEEAIGQLKVVKALQAEQSIGESIKRKLGEARVWGEKKAVAAAIALGGTFFVAYSSNALAFWKGARLIASSDGTVGKTYTVLFLLLDASFIIGQASLSPPYFLIATINRRPNIDVYSTAGYVPPPTSNSEATPYSLVLDNVQFSYPSRPSIPVLRGINLKLEGGKHTGTFPSSSAGWFPLIQTSSAIVGFSGSGKSTVMSLLERFYDPSSGFITLNGRSLKEYNLRWLRGQIGIIMQEPVLFDGTIMDNICHGLLNPHAKERIETIAGRPLDDKEVEALCVRAAERANAAEFVRRLPMGFRTLVGEGGTFLSGGQKQRIALARALVSEPPILIMDEATSSLDSRSERLILESLKRESGNGRCLISIAHRISTIKEADHIVVMSDGVVVESGTHESLMDRKGGYASLASGQGLDIDIGDDAFFFEGAGEDEKVPQTKVIVEAETEQEPPLLLPGQKRKILSLLTVNRLRTIASCIIGGAYQAEAVLFGHVISALNLCLGAGKVKDSGDLYALLFFVLGVAEWIAYTFNGSSLGWISERLLEKVKVACYSALLSRDVSEYEGTDVASSSETIAAVSADSGQIAHVTGIAIGTSIAVFVNLLTGIVLSHIIGWKIAVVVFSVVPILVFAGLLRIRTIAKFHTRHEKAYHRSSAIASEAVRSIRTIAALSREEDVCSVYVSALRAPYTESVRNFITSGFFMAVSFSISYWAYAFAYWWGSRFVASGEYSDRDFFTILPSLLFAAQASGQVFALAPDLTKARYGLSRVFNIMKKAGTLRRVEVIAKEKGRAESPVGQASTGLEVEFQGVRFSYPSRGDVEVLKGLSFRLAPGTYAALCGESGSGKSTIISLLQRFYDPTSGSITIGSSPLSSSHLPHLSYVPQEPTLFSGSIRFNLLLGVSSSSEEVTQWELDSACRSANILDFIRSLPDGYETDCGVRGNAFSGGQKQRLAIARALLRKPKILLLDECTAALDGESEIEIQKTIEKISHSCTIISIAHRLATIRKADQIFWLEEGVVIEQGNHEQLVKKNGRYAAAVKLQELSVSPLPYF